MSQIYSYVELSSQQFAIVAASLSPLKIPIEQTPQWGAFDDTIAGRTYLGSYQYENNGKLVAIASATLYRQRGRDWIWIKHGPLFASVPNTEIIKKMCATLKVQFQRSKGARPVFIRVTMPNSVKPLVPPFEHTMYEKTVVLNLSDSEDEILTHMSQSGRRGIRKAQSADVKIIEVDAAQAADDFEQLYYPVIRETAERDNFGVHPSSLYIKMLRALQPYVRFYVASHANKVVAWALTTEYSGQALYYYGASSAAARELHAPYLLHWQIIQAMKQRGNETYDFMGIASSNYPTLANVSQFKLKFSKNVQSVSPTFDLPLQPLKYRTLSLLIKTKRRIS